MLFPTLDQQGKALINKARHLGGSGPTVNLENHELLRLCAIVAADLNQLHLIDESINNEDLSNGYYSMPLEWFNQPIPKASDFVGTFLLLKSKIEDFETYFANLCEIHKHRVKYKRILETQRLPRVEPIVPRCLLEYKLMPSETLASWLVWRKWLYDIDNRAAQETGYLFEPILAASIGGISYPAKKSPIRRADKPSNGRQVDCLEGKNAYEFKMRVTIAASGQGRFKEELDFARDFSGYTPVLLVLDPTLSTRLEELAAEYAKYGGKAFIGNNAWKHIEDTAGTIMGNFVEKYVRVPLREVDASYKNLAHISISSKEQEIFIQIGEQSFSITRNEPQVDYGENEENHSGLIEE
jgi:hypothetical protein